MKSLTKAISAVAFAALPLAALAQSTAPVTRAQVRAELVQLEQAGYQPTAPESFAYPVDIQTAEARVAAQNGAAGTSGYGPAMTDSSQSGSSAIRRDPNPVMLYGR
jgi:hypothetical protein